MKRPVRIGVSANESGAHTRELHEAIRFAGAWLDLAVDPVFAEDGRDPRIATGAAVHLADAGVPIVVGHLSAAAALAAVEVYRRRDVAFIAPATSHPSLNPSGYEGVQRAFGVDTAVAEAMIAATPPGPRPTILVQDQIYGLSLAFELEAALAARGVRPLVVGLADPSWLEAAAVRDGAIYVSGIHEVCADAVMRLRRRRSASRIALGDDCFTPNFVALCGEDAEGCTVTTPAISTTNGGPHAGFDFQDGYFTSCTVAACAALQAILAYPGLRGAQLGREIRGRIWNTPFGPMAFDRAGELRGILYRTFELRGGRFEQQVGSLVAAH